ncbi:ribonuclease III [Aerosticca soli]|uniref:Ribonuclease 3 n=1 Tax=Aerosticca soli TaxID=2010829 RepID=A0A2Z6E403_9GAMM|nr:ribonuclease III [Aerosticca soli]MDI3261722.1 ribonuclease III [Fulvimonas sp.]BBD79815.1 ribonuclease III [Aerosticca soli]
MKLDYAFRDEALLQLALTHRSAGRPNNERLEFLGDALLGALVAELLFEVHPQASEGELSRLRAQLVNGPALAVIAREMGLGEALRLGPGELKSGGFRRDSILADAFEAVLAAVYLDGGFGACRTLVRQWFAPRVAALPKAAKDAKTRLQEWLQARALPLPSYELLDSRGEEHARIFEVRCAVSEPRPLSAQASGSSRRQAEQEAAQAVLDQLETAAR